MISVNEWGYQTVTGHRYQTRTSNATISLEKRLWGHQNQCGCPRYPLSQSRNWLAAINSKPPHVTAPHRKHTSHIVAGMRSSSPVARARWLGPPSRLVYVCVYRRCSQGISTRALTVTRTAETELTVEQWPCTVNCKW